MRRPVKKRNIVEPDLKYSSALIGKFINRVMREGKKAKATHIMYSALEIIEKKTGKPAIEVLDKALENAGPTMELKSRRVGGANYQVPIEVKPERRVALASGWIIDYARAQKGKPMKEKIAEEIINAFNGTGNAVKKKNDTHRMAEANKAFAHFAW